MGFTFEDMATAVETYLNGNVDIEIIDVDVPGQVLNAGEEGSFRVKVTNNGPLALTYVHVKLNAALVK